MPNLISPECVLLAASFFEARKPRDKQNDPDAKLKFYGRFGFTAEALQSAEMAVIQQAVIEGALETWGKRAEAMLAEGGVRLPFRKDIAAKGYPDYIKMFIGASTMIQPGVVSRYVDASGKRTQITDKREIYPGIRGIVSLAVRCYGGPGTTYNAGISLDLRNFLKLADGDRISTMADADEDFGPGEQAPDVPFDGMKLPETAAASEAAKPADVKKNLLSLLAGGL